MTKARSLLLVIGSLAIANAASFLTLSHNLSAGIYPIDADSIGIPLVEGLAVSLVLFAFLSAAIFMPKDGMFGVASRILCAVAALLSLALVAYWAIPHHYTIALGYLGVVVVGVVLAVRRN